MTEVNWNRIISANLGNLKDIVQKQYNQNKGVTVVDGRIEIHDDVLMQQTLVKQKELDVKNAVQSQGSMTRTINRTVTGKFNKNINAT